MTNEDIILKKLDFIEAELKEIRVARKEIEELKHDLNPLIKQTFQVMLRELGEVESGFQLEDSFVLIKRFLRNIKNMAYLLDQMENVIDLVHTIEPLMKSAMNHTIRELGTLEVKGVFRTYAAMLEIRGKIAQHYGPEDLEAMGDTVVELIGLLKKLANPETMKVLGKLAELPANMHLEEAKPAGIFGMVSAMGDPKMKEGLGVALQMAKALGSLK